MSRHRLPLPDTASSQVQCGAIIFFIFFFLVLFHCSFFWYISSSVDLSPVRSAAGWREDRHGRAVRQPCQGAGRLDLLPRLRQHLGSNPDREGHRHTDSFGPPPQCPHASGNICRCCRCCWSSRVGVLLLAGLLLSGRRQEYFDSKLIKAGLVGEGSKHKQDTIAFKTHWPVWHCQEGRHFAVYLFVHTKHSQKAGPFSVARLKMDLPFHNRLAFTGDVLLHCPLSSCPPCPSALQLL